MKDEKSNDWQLLILVLRLVYEISKGQESYWYPYLRLVLAEEGGSSEYKAWTENELGMLQDEYCQF